MQQEPQPGQILFYKEYQFGDGSSTDKLFIVLCVTDINSPCLVLKTTSKPKRYKGCQEGCDEKKKVFFIPSSWREGFPSNTYVQLPQIIEIPAAEIFAGTLSKRIHIMTALSIDCFRRIKDCLKKFKKDITQQHWGLITKT